MIESNTYQYRPDYAVHPGEILEETLESRNMKRIDLAKRCGLSVKTVSQILSGNAPVTTETAIQLERVLGVSANVWSNLDTNYRLSQAKAAARRELSKHAEWLEKFPIPQLVKRGIIEHKTDAAEMIEQLLDFFGVGSIQAWEKRIKHLQVVFRRSPSFQSSPESVAAWLRIGELRAGEVDCAPYNKSRFENVLRELNSLTREDPDVFEPKLKQLCAGAGVVLVFVSELPKTHLSGATRWLDKNKALIMLSLRYKSDDHFWFSFFHEAGHILHHSKKSIFLDELDMELNDEEEWADNFAADMLIPNKVYSSFVADEGYSTATGIQAFAQQQGVTPGIVVGRLQHDNIIPFKSLNYLKRRFKLVEKSD